MSFDQDAFLKEQIPYRLGNLDLFSHALRILVSDPLPDSSRVQFDEGHEVRGPLHSSNSRRLWADSSPDKFGEARWFIPHPKVTLASALIYLYLCDLLGFWSKRGSTSNVDLLHDQFRDCLWRSREHACCVTCQNVRTAADINR